MMSIDNDALRIATTLLELNRALDREFHEAAVSDDLNLIDLSVLRQVERGCAMPSSVARGLSVDPGRMTRIIDRLVALGYVEREVDTADRRRCRLHLTPAGQARLVLGRTQVARVMTEFLEGLTPEERGRLEASMESVRRLLDERQQVSDG